MNTPLADRYIEEVVKGIYEDYPELLERFGEQGKVKCREDNYHHFKHLQTAHELGEDQFFLDYAHWLTNLLVARGMEQKHVTDNFSRIQKALHSESSEEARSYVNLLSKAIQSLERRP